MFSDVQHNYARAFLRECRRLGPSFEPTSPAAFRSWGEGVRKPRLSEPSVESAQASLAPGSLPALGKPFIPWVRSLVRNELCSHKGGSSNASSAVPLLLGGGRETDAALDFLRQQKALSACTSASEEAGLRVDAVSGFVVKSESYYEPSRYVFTYNVSLTNVGTQPLRILGRQCEYRNASGELAKKIDIEQPEAVGLEGFTPLLEPGESFEFGSGTMLPSPQGSLTGGFLVAVENEHLSGEDAQVHAQMEEQDLMLRYMYFKGLGTEKIHVPLGRLNFDASVPCVATRA